MIPLRVLISVGRRPNRGCEENKPDDRSESKDDKEGKHGIKLGGRETTYGHFIEDKSITQNYAYKI